MESSQQRRCITNELAYRDGFFDTVPELQVYTGKAEKDDDYVGDPAPRTISEASIPCYNPADSSYLGSLPKMSPAQVRAKISAAKAASKTWRHSTFRQRNLLLKTMVKFIVENQDTICRVSARDSGKPMVDAAFGEVMVTCEKIWWLVKEGRQYLIPEKRKAGAMMFYKSARVEFVPVGVVGAIVPWNYPFHNVFNPLVAAVYAGNAIVIKVSEHASWSSQYYGRIIAAALAATGAPADLVQIVTGCGETGNALVTGGIDKLIFVGSTKIGKAVMEAASASLTPVVLELGGKDAFVVLDDADLDHVVPTALRGGLQSCGQNCAGAERFIIAAPLYEAFCRCVTDVVKTLRQGPPLGASPVDCGAMVMPGAAAAVHELVVDAVEKGAQVLAGGVMSDERFYPPTVLAGVGPGMRIWSEEVFGPVMSIIRAVDDAEAIALANDCPFGLGSAVWSRNPVRARHVGSQLQAGMTSINDFATTYMCQSLPFGGVKDSGFDRFAGIEGLRGLTIPKAVAEDRFPWLMRTNIPPMLQYPVGANAYRFTASLISMFYSPSLTGCVGGLVGLLKCFLPGKPSHRVKDS